LALNSIFSDASLSSHERIEKGLSLFGSAKDVADSIRSALNKPATLEQISISSYVHANGFSKIVLLSSNEPEYRLRLHVWPAGQRATEYTAADVHNHRWDFGSIVAVGSYTHEEFRQDKTGMVMRKYEYVPLNANGQFVLRYSGEARLQRVFRCLMVAGTRYTLDADVLHHVVKENASLTATLVLQSKRYRSSALVFSRRARKMREKVDSELLSLETIRSVLSNLLSVL